jgi:hypothetical protein
MPASPKLCAVSVDIDELHHYFAIHGLSAPATATPAYDIALPRIGAFAEAQGIPVTFFAVGEDLGRDASAATLRALARRGHVVESHSFGHRYDLTRLGHDAIAGEVEQGAAAIARVTGRRPAGFRAPGYTVSDALFDVLEDAGVAFDSSVFPCPPYYLAKAAAMGGMRLLGRSSRSILDTPRVLAAPVRPYRPGRPWHRRGGRRFVELPVQVTRWARLPVFGQTLALAGPPGARWLARMCVGEPLVNLELHAIDFIDATEGLGALVPHQPELRVPVGRRLLAFASALETLRRAGYAFVTLEEAARAFAS